MTRRVTPRPPRAWRLIPLVAGLGELAYFALAGRPETTSGQIRAYLPGILVTMAGLVIAGPWLTMIGSRIMARRASRSATLIAARRLSDNPKAGFRAVSGVVLALFVASVSVGIITTLVANDGPAGAGTAGNGILVEQSFGPDGPAAIPAMPQSALTKLGAIPGITGVATIHADPDSSGLGPGTGLVSCADLARLPALGRCPPKAAVAMISADLANPGINMSAVAATDWPDAAISAAALSGLPVQSILVATNGSTAAIERARTVLEDSVPGLGAPVTLGEQRAETTDRRLLAGYQQLANVVILVSLVIAGCSLAVSVASGLNERKRPFSLLRLTGAPLTVLRRVVALESAVPLLLVAVISAATGFLAAALFLRSQLDYSLQPPGVEYYAIVVAGLVASLAVIGSTLPLLDRMTGPETARNE